MKPSQAQGFQRDVSVVSSPFSGLLVAATPVMWGGACGSSLAAPVITVLLADFWPYRSESLTRGEVPGCQEGPGLPRAPHSYPQCPRVCCRSILPRSLPKV